MRLLPEENLDESRSTMSRLSSLHSQEVRREVQQHERLQPRADQRSNQSHLASGRRGSEKFTEFRNVGRSTGDDANRRTRRFGSNEEQFRNRFDAVQRTSCATNDDDDDDGPSSLDESRCCILRSRFDCSAIFSCLRSQKYQCTGQCNAESVDDR